jgi:hypothetical protein
MKASKTSLFVVSHVLVPPAIEALLSSDNCVVQGFLAAGHVCTIMGFEEYFPIAAKYAVPIVVTGFEPLDILDGIFMTVSQLEVGRHEVENHTYARYGGKGTVRRRRRSRRYSKSSPGNGVGWAKSRRADFSSEDVLRSTTPTAAFRSPASRLANRRSASAA